MARNDAHIEKLIREAGEAHQEARMHVDEEGTATISGFYSDYPDLTGGRIKAMFNGVVYTYEVVTDEFNPATNLHTVTLRPAAPAEPKQ